MTASSERRPGCQATVATLPTPDTQHTPPTPPPWDSPEISTMKWAGGLLVASLYALWDVGMA